MVNRAAPRTAAIFTHACSPHKKSPTKQAKEPLPSYLETQLRTWGHRPGQVGTERTVWLGTDRRDPALYCTAEWLWRNHCLGLPQFPLCEMELYLKETLEAGNSSRSMAEARGLTLLGQKEKTQPQAAQISGRSGPLQDCSGYPHPPTSICRLAGKQRLPLGGFPDHLTVEHHIWPASALMWEKQSRKIEGSRAWEGQVHCPHPCH